MYVMEEDPMAAPGMSLLLALIDTDPNNHVQGNPVNTAESDLVWPASTLDQQDKAREVLYEALYCIIEHSIMPQNRNPNMAIGRALAQAIKTDAEAPMGTENAQTQALGMLLRQLVNEALGRP